MKDSGIPWIGEIPKEWETARIKDVVRHLKSGGTPETANDTFYCETGTPWVAIGDMRHGGFIEDTQKHLTENGINSKSLIVYPQGTLLYSIYASIGKVSILKIPAAVNQAILAISLDEKYNELYAKYVLMALEDYVFSFANGNTQFNLNANIVSNLPIPLLPPTEQQAIAEFLDRKCAEVDEMIALQEQIIEELKAYKQSVITEAVTKGLNPAAPMRDSSIKWIGQIPEHWEVTKFYRICSVITDFVASGSFESLRINVPYLDYPDYAMLVRTVDLSGKGRTAEKVYISKHSYDFLSNSNLFGGEIILPNIGASVGDVYIVPNLYERMSLAPNSIMFKTKQCDRYWYYYFYSEAGKQSIFDICQSTAQPKFNKTELRDIRVCIPTKNEQQAIADYLDEKCADIDALIATKQQKIDSLKEYKKSIIYEYVTGKKEIA